MKKKQSNKDGMDIMETGVTMTPAELVASLEEFAQAQNATLLRNPDGTYTLTFPDGAQVITGFVQ